MNQLLVRLPAPDGFPFACLTLHGTAGRLTALRFVEQGPDWVADDPLAARAAAALHGWCVSGQPLSDDLPLAAAATPFASRLRQRLLQTRPGQPVTYGALAAELGTSPRAIGAACRANPLPILVPCHRVVAASGLGGYAGAQSGPLPAVKAWLLAHESI